MPRRPSSFNYGSQRLSLRGACGDGILHGRRHQLLRLFGRLQVFVARHVLEVLIGDVGVEELLGDALDLLRGEDVALPAVFEDRRDAGAELFGRGAGVAMVL